MGGISESWATYATRWASVEPLNGREFFASQQTTAQVTIRFRVRYDSKTKDITPKMRISYDSRLFNIESVINPREKDTDIVLMCIEKL